MRMPRTARRHLAHEEEAARGSELLFVAPGWPAIVARLKALTPKIVEEQATECERRRCRVSMFYGVPVPHARVGAQCELIGLPLMPETGLGYMAKATLAYCKCGEIESEDTKNRAMSGKIGL